MGSHSHAHAHATLANGGVAAHRAAERARLATALLLTVAVLIIEVAGGFLSHSIALLSDAGHVLTDISAQALALLALVFAARPADQRRTYGYYRLEILSALINGVVLLGIAAVIAAHAYERIRAPVPVNAVMMLGTAAAGLAVNLVGAWLLRESHSLNVRGAYLHILSDVMASLAVIVGALVMLASARAFIVDAIVSCFIAAVIVVSAFTLVRDAVNVLLEAVPAHVDVGRVSEDIARLAGVREVHDLHIWTITSGMYALSAHLVLEGPAQEHGAAPHGDAILTAVKEMLLREHHIAHSTLQLESAIYEHVEHVH